MHPNEILAVGEWTVPSPDLQSAAVDAAVEQWASVGWPEGLLSYTALAADDGRTVLHLSRWQDRGALRRFTGDIKTQWSAGVDRAVPGVVRRGVHTYYPYDTPWLAAGETGFLVLTEVEADTADAARGWRNVRLSLEQHEPEGVMLASTVYLSLAGQRLLHIGGWTDSTASGEKTARPGLSEHLASSDIAVRLVRVTRSTSWRTVGTS